MTRDELAAQAVVTTTLTADYEDGANTPRPADLEAIRTALERAGVKFLDQDGVKLHKKRR